MPFLTSNIGLFFIAFVGMVAHFLKKKIKGENFSSIESYFKTHLKSVLLSLIATWIGWLAYMQTLKTGVPANDILTVFGIGYMCDSLFNKYDEKSN